MPVELVVTSFGLISATAEVTAFMAPEGLHSTCSAATVPVLSNDQARLVCPAVPLMIMARLLFAAQVPWFTTSWMMVLSSGL